MNLRHLYNSGYSVPLVAPQKISLSPWLIYQKIYFQNPESFFFDSTEPRSEAQRYSYLGWRPFTRLSYKEELLQVSGEWNLEKKTKQISAELRKLFGKIRVPKNISFNFFSGGAVGYWAYELAQVFERISLGPKKGPSLPWLELLFFRDLAVFDHEEGTYHLISWLFPEKGVSFDEALKKAEKTIQEMQEAISDSTHHQPAGGKEVPGSEGTWYLKRFRPEISQNKFEQMVRRAKDYIAAGDIYQANLSQRFSFEFKGSRLALYDRLREANPAPYSAVFHLGDLFIASSSPELLVAKKGNRCVTCPIAGTRPRGRTSEERKRFMRELFSSEKERAEHLMLVDLERNDLGRVSEWKSVQVKDFMRLEKYARVIHIVSEVTGRLRAGKDGWDLIEAMFPGGTITGCPKIRSMEIIDELEPVRRGIYTGSVGYVGFDGNLMLNIAIRTLVLMKNRGYLQVGAGIVADSDPGREYEETLHKGEALAEALMGASLVL